VSYTLKRQKIIVFAPHPDDETFCCGGVIAKKIFECKEVLVVVMTDGRNALSSVFGIERDPTPEQLKKIRRDELINASKILGVPDKNILFLDYEDTKLGKSKEQAESQVVEILRSYEPSEIYFPHENDFNMDHKVSSQIIRKCNDELEVAAIPFRYSVCPRFIHISTFVDRLCNPLLHNICFVDISQFLKKKESAIMEYKSQITILSKEQKQPVTPNYQRFLKKQEIFYT
jgi:N-acetylglucosamine malate deacetylase 1